MKIHIKFLTALFLVFFCLTNVNGAVVKIACKAKGREAELIEKAVKAWTKKYGNKHSVEIVTLPRASNECLALYLQLLSAETFDVDVFQVDLAWIGILADYLHSLNEFFVKGELDVNDYFPIIRNYIYSNEGKIVVLPWYTDCGVMYYRRDLLKKYGRPVPRTWE